MVLDKLVCRAVNFFVDLQRTQLNTMPLFGLSWLVGWIGGQIKFSCMLGLRVEGSSRPFEAITCQNLQVCSREELSSTCHHKRKKTHKKFNI